MADRFTLKKKSKIRYFDSTFLLIVVLLLVFGLVMLYSVSSYDGNKSYGDSAYYFKKQLISSAVGIVLMAGITIFPYSVIKRLCAVISVFSYIFATVMLLLIIPFGSSKNGATRWIYVGPVSVQPAEISKIAIILVTATIILWLGDRIDTRKGFWFTLTPALIHMALIFVITRNLSSAVIVGGIAFMMSFVAAKEYKRYLLMLFCLCLAAGSYVALVVLTKGNSASFRGERILAWLDLDAYASGKGYQTIQALYAIGSGGYMGKGIGESMQKLGYLPEAQNDMIFSIICEELGFVGGLCVIALFVLLLWRCLFVVMNAPDKFGVLLVVGFMAHIAIQVILNIGVVTNTFPNTGISLPFISYGGSSVVMLLCEVGLVMCVQRSILIKDV